MQKMTVDMYGNYDLVYTLEEMTVKEYFDIHDIYEMGVEGTIDGAKWLDETYLKSVWNKKIIEINEVTAVDGHKEVNLYTY